MPAASGETPGRLSRRALFKHTSVLSLGAVGAPSLLRAPGRPSPAQPAGAADPPFVPRHGGVLRGLDLPTVDRAAEGRFGLMFKRLPAFAPPDELLTALGVTMQEDPGTDVDDNDRLNDNPNPLLSSGVTFLGQFIDHDITMDTTPLAEQRRDPHAVTNFRSARYDLDAMYGLGPGADPRLYDPSDPAKLSIVVNDNGVEDAPRRSDGVAVIADPRNDQHLVICQLHVAMAKFHGALVDHLRRQGVPEGGVFDAARRLARWHYQWVVIHDFLPRIVGQGVVDEVLLEVRGKTTKVDLAFYKPKNPTKAMLPVEFSVAAYRFGHSMARPRYTVREGVSKVPLFEAAPSENNLNGSRPIPARLRIDWNKFFGPSSRPSRRIDARLAAPLFILPGSVVPPPDPQTLLAVRNLLRGKRLGLPSGQRVAAAMGGPVLTNAELGLDEPEWQGEAPLWFYVLKEAELLAQGQRLGPVGGRIVTEVLVGLLSYDRGSYLNQRPAFEPAPPIAASPGQFSIRDLLGFAGLV
jgi:hypothetical protein